MITLTVRACLDSALNKWLEYQTGFYTGKSRMNPGRWSMPELAQTFGSQCLETKFQHYHTAVLLSLLPPSGCDHRGTLIDHVRSNKKCKLQ